MQSEMVTLPGRQGAMHVRRWGGQPASLALLHANGMNAHAYRQLIVPIAEEHGVIAFDHRGHGRTALPADPDTLRDWHIYAEDAGTQLAAAPAPEEGWTLIGHSMGAVISLMVAAAGLVPVHRIIMIEPVVVPVAAQWLSRSPMRSMIREILPVAKKAAARRASFPDVETVRASYASKPFFAGWADGVLDDYLVDGLAETDDGVRLACAPAWEAATFAAQGHSFWAALDDAMTATKGKISALYGETGSTASGTSRIRLSARGVVGTVIAGTSHLAPQERPADCATLIKEAIRQHGAD